MATRSTEANHKTNLKMKDTNTDFLSMKNDNPYCRVAEVNGSFYDCFKSKWAGRKTYECPNIHSAAATIEVNTVNNFKPLYGSEITATVDLWTIPNIHGWGFDEKKRSQFMRELKKAGLHRVNGQRLEYYKTLSLNCH